MQFAVCSPQLAVCSLQSAVCSPQLAIHGVSFPAIAFYISGHGFGHASRQVEIINAFAARRPDVPLFVRTSVAEWLLRNKLAGNDKLETLLSEVLANTQQLQTLTGTARESDNDADQDKQGE